jgi:hypothetical protein
MLTATRPLVFPIVMERMLTPRRPFYKADTVVRLEKIDEQTFAEFVDARFAASGLRTQKASIASSVQSALAALVRQDIVMKGQGRYLVNDSLYREWMARRTFQKFPGAVRSQRTSAPRLSAPDHPTRQREETTRRCDCVSGDMH